MKNKWGLFASIVQIIVGVGAIFAYTVLAVHGEPMGKWTVTLILAIAFLIMGSLSVADWCKAKRGQNETE